MTRSLRALVGALLCALLAALAPVAYAAPSKDPRLQQTVRADEQQALGRAELTRGHVDLGPRIAPVDQWKVQVRDDTQNPPKWRNLDEVLVRVSDQALLELPADPQYAFLGIPGGSSIHVVPQTQNQAVIWLGWNTQDPKVTERIERGAKLVLHRVQGPGAFHVFLQNGFDPPQPLWAGGGPDGQEIWVDTNTHTHANWVFGKPGVYLVDFSIVATGRDGRVFEDRATLRFAVGDKVTAEEAWAAKLPAPATQAPTTAAPTTIPESQDMPMTTIAILIAGGAIAAVAIGALIRTVVQGRARDRARREEDHD